MNNEDIVLLLRHMIASYSVLDDAKHRFQIIAYQKAADAIDSSSIQVKDLLKEDRLEELPGIGPSLQAYLKELIETGKVEHFEKVLSKLPSAMFPLLDIPSFGPKKSFRIVTEFGLTDPKTVMKDVEKLALEYKIAPLTGFGEKSQSDILRALSEYKKGVTKTSRMALPLAGDIADQVLTHMNKCNEVITISTLGSLRRQKETIGDVDLAVATYHPREVLDHFVNYPYLERIIEKGDASASILVSGGKHIDLMVQPPEAFGSLLQHFTGSKEHNVKLREYALKKGLSLSEYGIRRKDDHEKLHMYDTEEKFYKALDLAWIPPEIRENTGEIELAMKNSLPKLIELADIKGDFHIHSNFRIEPSHDLGISPMEEMLSQAIAFKYDYLGFSEHNPSHSKHTSKEIYAILSKRKDKIDQLQKSNKSIRIFSLLETDILPNGDLAIDEDALSLLDATIVSVHSVFTLSKTDMTKRVLKGLSHKKAKILAHPTGRLLNQRNGYDLDWNEIFAFCVSENKALEINSAPSRLDLSDQLVRMAVNAGVKMFINTDSHATDQMQLMKYGVGVARRGWATKDDILNSLRYNDLRDWFSK
ncbi:MAG: DNA polymerase/3'-5' exonuclease PolX [Candidatus Levybacteria bacterium]|nr:DNA polymerase/3'-5' exonuclease PolX [Candidatus Levybacteria bacterium]